MKYNIKEKSQECFSCLNKPCMNGCPLSNDITSAIKLCKEEKYKEAFEMFANTTVLSSLCGKICPHESQCQGKCIRGIRNTAVEIGNVESFLGDLALENNWEYPMLSEEKIDKKVAVVGGGPAGITCAAFLKRLGVTDVTIFEKYDYLGGIMKHGIPAFRLDKELLEKNMNKILELGINVEYNKELGKDITIDELTEKYDAVFLGIGANISSKMWIDGENLEGVCGANEILEKNSHPDYAGKNVIVSGGGNVAMDIARTVNKMGAKSVTVVYRRSRNEMPAEKIEIQEAMDEGVNFAFQNNILEIIGDGKVEKIKCIKTELVQKEGETRLSPVNIEGSEYFMDADYVMMAVGSKAEKEVVDTLNVELDKKGKIVVNEKMQTSIEKVFSAGDVAGGTQTVAFAARGGRDAAYAIVEFLK